MKTKGNALPFSKFRIWTDSLILFLSNYQAAGETAGPVSEHQQKNLKSELQKGFSSEFYSIV